MIYYFNNNIPDENVNKIVKLFELNDSFKILFLTSITNDNSAERQVRLSYSLYYLTLSITLSKLI